MSDTKIIYTSLKNADLACISAKLAIQNYLKNTHIKELRRYTKWTLTGSDLTPETLEKILTDSYYIANPNKESASTESLPNHSKWTQYHADVRLKEGYLDTYTRDKINQTFNTQIDQISKSTLWCLFTEDDYSPEKEASILENVVSTNSQRDGLLANPLYEDIAFSHYHV